MTRKRGVFYFRRRLPLPYSGEVATSLRTRSFAEARWLAEGLARQFDDTLRGQAAMHPDIRAFLRKLLNERLQRARTELLRSPYVPIASPDPDFPAPDSNEAAIERTANMMANFMDTRKSRDIRPAMPAALAFAAKYGLPDDSDSIAELSLGMNHVAEQVYEQKLRWLREGISERIELEEPVIASQRLESPEPIAPVTTSPKLSEVLPGFMDEMKTAKGWTGQTLSQNGATLRMFQQVVGDLPVQSYDRKAVTKFRDVLRLLPANYSRKREWASLSLVDIVAVTGKADVARLAMKTVKRHFAALGQLFESLKERGEFVGENPAYGFKSPKSKKRANEGRQEWKGEQLTKLFKSPVWTGCLSKSRRSTAGKLIIKDEKYWLPLLALYHGNRLEEFAQLRIEDVQEEDGITFVRIHDEGTRQIKNPQSRRRVPLHPELRRLGFLEYLRAQPQHVGTLVFPNLRLGG